MDIQELGARIKRIRKGRNMTLKDIEGLSKVSATHISEIERGKTSPTIGALSRIAGALGKDTAFFLEMQNLEDVSKIKYEEREKARFKTTGGYYQPLTRGIPGGRLQAYRIRLEPGGELTFNNPVPDGEATILCEHGELSFNCNGETETLRPKDSVHFIESDEDLIFNPSSTESTDLVLISTHRHTIDDL